MLVMPCIFFMLFFLTLLLCTFSSSFHLSTQCNHIINPKKSPVFPDSYLVCSPFLCILYIHNIVCTLTTYAYTYFSIYVIFLSMLSSSSLDVSRIFPWTFQWNYYWKENWLPHLKFVCRSFARKRSYELSLNWTFGARKKNNFQPAPRVNISEANALATGFLVYIHRIHAD